MHRFKSSLLCLMLLAAACRTTTQNNNIDSVGQVAKPSSLPLTRSVHLAGGDPAQVQIGGQWATLSTSAEGVTQLKAGPRGSLMQIGESRLWLRSGSHVELAQDAEGALLVAIQAGQARLANGSKDVLLSRRSLDLKPAMALTSARPESAAWSLELESEPELRGVGELQVGSGDELEALSLRSVTVNVNIVAGMAETEVEHVFYNPADQQREGTFRFPAPDGVMVTGLAMEIGGRLMEGEFVERVKARQVYESIVDQMQDPALLEWQQGGWFKLRVFPIEALSEKRVVLRYVAPLQKSIEGYEYRYLATPPELSSVAHFEVKLNGSTIAETTNLRSSRDVVIALPESSVPSIVAQEKGDFEYRVVTVKPQLPEATPSPQPRKLIIIADSSRSALDHRKLSQETIALLLAELGPKDEFAFFAHDIGPHESQSGFVAATARNQSEAVRFFENLELDGASDLGASLLHAAKLAKTRPEQKVQVVYVGDGTATWGARSEEALHRSAAALDSASLYAAVLGRGASTRLWNNLTGAHAGRSYRPHTSMDARKIAFVVARADTGEKMHNASFEAPEGVDVFPRRARTIFAGHTQQVVLRAAKGTMPKSITLLAELAGRKIRQDILVQEAVAGKHLAKRWASEELKRMEEAKADKDKVVALSKEFGVLSKHTSLLVLESEEAYRQHNIKRQQEKLVATAPQVSGGDLDNLHGHAPSLSPNHIQPGDPEIRIPAPADARSVVVVFPFGDTKIAHYDDALGTWNTRFLIGPDTEDGRYWVRATIEHADGRLEDLSISYTVDTQAPKVTVKVLRFPNGKIRVQVLQHELWDNPDSNGLDAARVEIRFPWEATIRIPHRRDGVFLKTLRPPVETGKTIFLRVVVTDSALNQRVLELDVPVRDI